MLYTEQDLEISMDKIETVNFHEQREVGGIKFWAYNAGHVLGAAMFMIEIAGTHEQKKAIIIFRQDLILLFCFRGKSIIHRGLFERRGSSFNGC